jgi:multidrug resistance efflux pump
MMHLTDYNTFKKTTAFFMLQPCRAMYGFILTMFVTCAALLVWASFAPMDDMVKVQAVLRPVEAVSSVRCVSGGEVTEKQYVNDGLVREGGLLFTLDTSSPEKELTAERAQLAKLRGDMQTAETLLETVRTETFPALPVQSDAYVRSAAYLYEKKRYETVIADVKTKLDREKNKPASLAVPQNVQDMQAQYEQNVLQYNTWKNTQLTQTLETYRQQQSDRNSAESRIAELERVIKNSTMCAPISGRITEVKKMNCGDYIMAGEEVLRIVPEGSSALKAELYVDPSYIARVAVGNPVKIRFPGLPPSRYGQLETTVSLIPPDCTLLSTGSPVFVAEAPVPEPYLVSKDGKRAQLLPGITAEGRIITERSTALRMVLRKLDFIN